MNAPEFKRHTIMQPNCNRSFDQFNLSSFYLFIFLYAYSSGVYDDSACSSKIVNHAMLLIGYTKDAWILKNWWSSKWGDNGYMYMAKGRDQCAIASYAAYATILPPKRSLLPTM